jgi:large subunit ribosomal protein L35
MAKQKTRKSALKRFKVSGTGKILHRSSFARHLRSSKSATQKRRQNQVKIVTGVRARRIRRMLGIA